MRDELRLTFEFLGVILIMSGVFSIVAFCMQYYMWRDYRVRDTPLSLYFKEQRRMAEIQAEGDQEDAKDAGA